MFTMIKYIGLGIWYLILGLIAILALKILLFGALYGILILAAMNFNGQLL